MDGYRQAELSMFANWVEQHEPVLLAVDPYSVMVADGTKIKYYKPTGGLDREDWPLLKDCFEAKNTEPYTEHVLISLLKGDLIRRGYDAALASTAVEEASYMAHALDMTLCSVVENTCLDNVLLWLHGRAEELKNELMTRAPRCNRGPGRTNSTADIARFAKQRHGRMTWKEMYHDWRQLYPDDTRVKDSETIRDAYRRHHGDKA